jgi:hypothetical protein
MSSNEISFVKVSGHVPPDSVLAQQEKGSIQGANISKLVGTANAVVGIVNKINSSVKKNDVLNKAVEYELRELSNTISSIDMRMLSSESQKIIQQVKSKMLEIHEHLDSPNITERTSQMVLEVFNSLNGVGQLESTLIKSVGGSLQPKVKAEKYIQIPVLPQLEDGTHSGVENCGFHALKNSIASILFYSGHPVLSKQLFEDQDLFLQFYTLYCAPLVEKQSTKDASIPLIREIIQNVCDDGDISVKFYPLQVALKEHESELVIIATSSLADPTKAFIGEEGVLDTEKVLKFVKSTSESTLTVIFGDEDEGHWYVVTAKKDVEGNVGYSCCDSFEADHARLGEGSPFMKATKSLEELFTNPDKIFDHCILDICDDLEKKAGWIGGDSEPLLLDDTPNKLLARSSEEKGSSLEINLRRCNIVYQKMTELGWMQSSDIRKQNAISTIRDLMGFYGEELSSQACKLAVIAISELRDEDYLQNILSETIQEMTEYSTQCEQDQQSLVLQTAGLGKWLSKLYLEKDKLANNKILQEQLKVEMSIEDDLAEDPVKEIISNVKIYLLTYQIAKEKGRLDDFYEEVGTPSCFTGRMGGAADFLPRVQWSELDAMVTQGYIYLLSDVVLSNVISEAVPLELDDDDEAARDYIKNFTIEDCRKNAEGIAQSFIQFGFSEKAKPFFDFLLKEGFVESLPVQKWDEVVTKLLESKHISEMLSRGKTQALRDWI